MMDDAVRLRGCSPRSVSVSVRPRRATQRRFWRFSAFLRAVPPSAYPGRTQAQGKYQRTQRRHIGKDSVDPDDGIGRYEGRSVCGSNVPPNPRVLPEAIPLTLITAVTTAGGKFDAAMTRRRAASREDESLGHLDQITVADGHSI